MPKDTVSALADIRSQLAKLEKKLHAELAKLPAKYGYRSPEDFVAAFTAATGTPAKSAPAAPAPRSSKRKARVAITPEIVARVKKLVGEEKTGSEIAKLVGISLPSVQNIKTKLGLVKKRK